MKMIRKISAKNGLFLLATALTVGINVAAQAETLECTLYSADSMDIETGSSVELKGAGLKLESFRRSSLCVFSDGRVADKQYVVVNRAIGDGSTGSNLGYSVYTMENGDSISAEFTGNWGNEGFTGVYKVIGGTGSYSDATGDGTITGARSPWTTTSTVGIVLRVTTP